MPSPQNNNESVNIFQVSSTLYGVMTLIGLAVLYFVHGNLVVPFDLKTDHYPGYQLILIGVLCSGVLLIAGYFFELYFKGFRELRRHVIKILGPTSAPMAVYLALVSAIGEEILFRGAIQPAAGLLATSIIFGLLHLGPQGNVSSWSVWAFMSGLLLGWTYEASGSLWPAIIAHFAVNLFSIFRLRRRYRNLEPMVERLRQMKDEFEKKETED